MTTQNPAQDVSDAAIAAAFREADGKWFQSQHELRTWVEARARELQQAQLDGCTESNCQRCTTAPYARGDMKHAGIGSYPNATPQSSAPVVGDDRAPIAEGGWSSGLR